MACVTLNFQYFDTLQVTVALLLKRLKRDGTQFDGIVPSLPKDCAKWQESQPHWFEL